MNCINDKLVTRYVVKTKSDDLIKTSYTVFQVSLDSFVQFGSAVLLDV